MAHGVHHHPGLLMNQTNWAADDGYRYGVMFNDGAIAAYWNGSTQRERAAEAARIWAAKNHPDNITLARQLPGRPWKRVKT